MIARYRSCPAVSQICALIVFASTWIDRVANSTPMVDFESRLNSLRVNRLNRLDFPTPESPIRTTGRISCQHQLGRGVLGRKLDLASSNHLTFEEKLPLMIIVNIAHMLKGLTKRSSLDSRRTRRSPSLLSLVVLRTWTRRLKNT